MNLRFVQWLLLAVFVVSQSAMALGVSSQVQANTLSDAELAAYTLPDGSLPVICLTPNEDGTTTHVMCEGCFCCSFDGAAFSLGQSVRNCLSFDVERASQNLVALSQFRLERTRGPPLGV